MAQNNTVKLTFVADTTSFDRGTRDAAANAEDLTHSLKDVSAQAKSTKTIMKGAGDAAQLFGGDLGNTAVQAGYALASIKDLTKGTAGLAKSMGAAKLATFGVIAAIATAGVAVAAHIDHTSMMNEVYRTAADTADTVVGSVQFLTQKIPGLSSVMDSARHTTRGWSDDAHGLTNELLSQTDAMKKLHEASLFMAPDANPGGDAFADVGQVDVILAQQASNVIQGSSSVAKAVKSGGSSVNKAIDDAAQKAKAKIDNWQSVLDKFRGIGKGIADSLAPTLIAGDQGLLLFKGPSLLDKLNQQLRDTLHLQKDLAALKKQGLSGDLIGQLTAGGLSSLPAADELLASGRGGISAVNRTAGAITAAGGTIASNEAQRQFNAQKNVTVKIDVSGGESDFKKMFRKWIRIDGAASLGLKAA